jgi:hypothetical protein
MPSDDDIKKAPDQRINNEQLNTIIEFEIDRLQKESMRPGWTAWALLGALASILWLIGSVLLDSKPNPKILMYLLLLMSLAIDSGWILFKSLAWNVKNKSNALRFRFADYIIAPLRYFIVVLLIRSLILLLLLSHVDGLVSSWSRYLVGAYLLAEIIIVSFVMFLSYSQLPLAQNISPIKKNSTMIIRILLVCLLFSSFLLFLLPLTQGSILPALVEWRISGLVIMGSVIILILSHPRVQSPLLETLISLRRELVFGANLESVFERIKIALEGLAVPDVLQLELSPLLHDYGMQKDILSKVEEYLLELQTLESISNRQLTESESQRIEELRKVTIDLMKEANNFSERIKISSKSFYRRANLLKSVHPDCKRELQPLYEKIELASESVGQQLKNVIETMKNFQN